MENFLSDPKSGVEIEITAPSATNSEDEMEEEFIPRAMMKDSKQNEMNNFTDSNGSEENRSQKNREDSRGEDSVEVNDLSEHVEKDLSLKDEENSKIEQETSKESDEQKPANLEMIGDRVLIERDGKFELVDVSEIKAEYFEMLGINPPENKDSVDGVDAQREEKGNTAEEKSPIEDKTKPRERPKTTISESRRKTRNSSTPQRRTTSANLNRSKNDEYSHIKSMYGLTEDQWKAKKRREEAIAKRKREEKNREEEEMRRKREDAESAFQAWLVAKLEEAKERRRQEAQSRPDPTLEQRKRENAESAYEEWLISKKRQDKLSKEYEYRRRSEEACQFVIRDRHLCDEAFKSWLRKKRAESKAKALLKNKKKKSKPKLKKKEPLPLNSKNITYLEYYGYRNHVVL